MSKRQFEYCIKRLGLSCSRNFQCYGCEFFSDRFAKADALERAELAKKYTQGKQNALVNAGSTETIAARAPY